MQQLSVHTAAAVGRALRHADEAAPCLCLVLRPPLASTVAAQFFLSSCIDFRASRTSLFLLFANDCGKANGRHGGVAQQSEVPACRLSPRTLLSGRSTPTSCQARLLERLREHRVHAVRGGGSRRVELDGECCRLAPAEADGSVLSHCAARYGNGRRENTNSVHLTHTERAAARRVAAWAACLGAEKKRAECAAASPPM